MTISDKPLFLVCPFTVLRRKEWDVLSSVLGQLAILETPFSTQEEIPENVSFLSVFSPDELTQIRRTVEKMEEMGQDDSAILEQYRIFDAPKPYLQPKVSEIADALYERLEEKAPLKSPPNKGLLIALLDRWDREQIDLVERFSTIGEKEKKLFQDVLAMELGPIGIKTDLNSMDFGTYQPSRRMMAWKNCIQLYKDPIPRIWVTPSSAIMAWLEENRWIEAVETWKGSLSFPKTQELVSFWQNVQTFSDFEREISRLEEKTDASPKLEIRLGQFSGRLQEDFGNDFLFCSIRLDG